MNWARDGACLCSQETQLRRMFKFEPRASIAITILKSNEYQMRIWSLETEKEWSNWLRYITTEHRTNRGIVMMYEKPTCWHQYSCLTKCNSLATRAGEKPTSNNISVDEKSPSRRISPEMSYSEWRDQKDSSNVPTVGVRRTQTFAALAEEPDIAGASPKNQDQARQPGIRYLPFTYNTFKNICARFQVHESITRAITRTDIPSFSGEKINMERQPAYIYSCRTSNSWPSDMALSATHFPRSGLTFSILYGCTSSMEDSILQKLQPIREEAAHPLLLPGVFVELELERHTSLVEESIAAVETLIFTLDFQVGGTNAQNKAEADKRNEAKRDAWLDLTYLRNSIVTWNSHIWKMSKHVETLKSRIYTSNIDHEPHVDEDIFGDEVEDSWEHVDDDDMKGGGLSAKDKNTPNKPNIRGCEMKLTFQQRMEDVGEKIKARLNIIQEEYEEKIRDCSMRVDGMAMATKWSHSETAVEMALASNRESRVMKSISMVTMIFLPGTFFGTVFSMTFFQWSDGDKGKPRVSSLVWIYFLVTAVFTVGTIGMWYFFVFYRPANRKQQDSEKIAVD
ncbi:hypothetical protein GQ44DRAFT_217980 [Phaeosphaeriaceae sp. PMI808]|nr:hypothetical protein GQ44DRAFT_217980 [Phaeosphaeriaceae sp. PMI808]